MENSPKREGGSQASATPPKLAARPQSMREEGHSPPSWASSHHPSQGWPFLPQQNGLGGIKQEAGSPPPVLGHHGHHGHLPDLLSLPHPLNRLPKISSEEELEYDCEDGIEEEEEGIEVKTDLIKSHLERSRQSQLSNGQILSFFETRWTYLMGARPTAPCLQRRRKEGFSSLR